MSGALGGINLDFVGGIVGVVLTLMVFSYLLGDNPAYRLALHLFVGAVSGYAFGVVSWEILIMRVGVPLLLGQQYALLIPLLLGVLLLIKVVPKHAFAGNVSVAFLVGTGTAVAISGAVLGTIVPQVSATARAAAPASWANTPLGWLDGLLVVAGTVCTLLAFGYIGRRRRERPVGCAWPAAVVTHVGRWFLVVAFGVAFGGAVSAALSVFVGRVQYLIDFVTGLF